jgi:DNA-binding GntR family transcriptional regulator
MPIKKKDDRSQKADLDQKAYQGIRQMLFYNEIIPGQKIKYQDLADRIGVSITPVIHALKWLEFKNIVRREPNRGYFINEVSLKEIREIYDSRLLIEVSLVPAIIDHLDDAGIRNLRQSHDAYHAAVAHEDYYGRLMTDMKFHLTLASLSQCRIQLKMLQELFDLLLLKYTRNLLLLGITASSRQEHDRIFHCIASRDGQGLQAALNTHLEHVRTHITQGFQKMAVGKKEAMVDMFTFQ